MTCSPLTLAGHQTKATPTDAWKAVSLIAQLANSNKLILPPPFLVVVVAVAVVPFRLPNEQLGAR